MTNTWLMDSTNLKYLSPHELLLEKDYTGKLMVEPAASGEMPMRVVANRNACHVGSAGCTTVPEIGSLFAGGSEE